MKRIDNRSEFDLGWKKAKNLIRKNLARICRNVMREMLEDSINHYYDERANLTGNLINSFAVGFYIDGKLRDILLAHDVGLNKATYMYVSVGEGGFKDWDTGETVDFVKPYRDENLSFQSTEKGYGEKSAEEFLRSFRGVASNGISIVIVAAAPYAEYLKNKRKLDILTNTRLDTPSIFNRNLKPMNDD